VDLSSQDVEQVGGGGRVGDLDVAVLVLAIQLVLRREHAGLLVAELEPPLQSAGRVLWTLAVVAMWQRHDQTGSLQPLGLSRSDELINDTLGVVGKVTELSLPHHESVGRGQGVSVFETKTARSETGQYHPKSLASPS